MQELQSKTEPQVSGTLEQKIDDAIHDLESFYTEFVTVEHILHNATREELLVLKSFIDQELTRGKEHRQNH